VPYAPVLWVNTVGLRVPRLTAHDIRRALEIIRAWLTPTGDPEPSVAKPSADSPEGTAPEVLRPAMWPSFRHRWLAALNQRLLSRAVARGLAKRAPDKAAIIVSTLPIVPGLFRDRRFTKKVYYCVDDFTQWHGIDGETMRRLEAETLTECDLLIATSTPILNSRGPLSPRAVLLTHGVDVDHFAKAAPNPDSPLAALPRPIVGMFGLFDRRVDADLLAATAAALPTATFAVLGPVVDRGTGEFDHIPNLRFFGAVPYDALPGHVAHFDVCILPYVLDETTRSINPLKLKEYLASGKPVVATPLPEAVRLGEYLILADSDRFPEQVRRAAATPRPSSPALAGFLKEESWDGKAARFLQEILREDP
jgi:glycosyltransferase involved in cell wall biosynthesis